MAFSKTFPRNVKGSPYPIWEEVFLSAAEDKGQEELCRKKNIELMKQCIDDAKAIMKDKQLKDFQTDMVNMSIALFEKRASHEIYWKEDRAKEKFNRLK